MKKITSQIEIATNYLIENPDVKELIINNSLFGFVKEMSKINILDINESNFISNTEWLNSDKTLFSVTGYVMSSHEFILISNKLKLLYEMANNDMKHIIKEIHYILTDNVDDQDKPIPPKNRISKY